MKSLNRIKFIKIYILNQKLDFCCLYTKMEGVLKKSSRQNLIHLSNNILKYEPHVNDMTCTNIHNLYY
jgi:hypothetical protein